MIGRMTRWHGSKQTGSNGFRGCAKKSNNGGGMTTKDVYWLCLRMLIDEEVSEGSGSGGGVSL